MVYKGSSRTAGAVIQTNLLSKNQNKIHNLQLKNCCMTCRVTQTYNLVKKLWHMDHFKFEDSLGYLVWSSVA